MDAMDKTAKVSACASNGARNAILSAFRGALFENGSHRISVVELVRRAGVARSTFYEHFENVEDVLRENLRRPFGPLAATARGEQVGAALELVLGHMYERRTYALALLDGGAGSIVRNTLVEMIGGSPAAAYAIAGAQLATIAAWLEGRLPITTAGLTGILERLSQHTIRSDPKQIPLGALPSRF
ncbi:MAG: helix-turn-helix transcriptional regulator [Candidatus Eremiobacteraeota bacterium]|nr:helix-turn-helix transcriptional regulator [Candidatus Eremiobacteraeota bacterium]